MSANPEAVTRVNPYEQLGGEAAVRQLVERFYDEMAAAPEARELRAMHAADLGPMRQTLFEFLSGWLGGPRTYFERPNAKCLMSAHGGLPIGKREAEQWLLCMRRSLDALDTTPKMRELVGNALTQTCNSMVNR